MSEYRVDPDNVRRLRALMQERAHDDGYRAGLAGEDIPSQHAIRCFVSPWMEGYRKGCAARNRHSRHVERVEAVTA